MTINVMGGHEATMIGLDTIYAVAARDSSQRHTTGGRQSVASTLGSAVSTASEASALSRQYAKVTSDRLIREQGHFMTVVERAQVLTRTTATQQESHAEMRRSELSICIRHMLLQESQPQNGTVLLHFNMRNAAAAIAAQMLAHHLDCAQSATAVQVFDAAFGASMNGHPVDTLLALAKNRSGTLSLIDTMCANASASPNGWRLELNDQHELECSFLQHHHCFAEVSAACKKAKEFLSEPDKLTTMLRKQESRAPNAAAIGLIPPTAIALGSTTVKIAWQSEKS